MYNIYSEMNGESFNLITNKSELSTLGKHRGEMRYHKATRVSGAATGDDFAGKQLEWTWNINSDERWDPQHSYVRMRCTLESATPDTALTEADGIGPNMGLVANLFQNGRIELNGVQVSKIDAFMPQVDALYNRMGKSKSWLDSVGNHINWWEPSVHKRVRDISSDGFLLDDFDTFSHLDLGYTAVNTLAIDVLGVMTIEDGAGAVAMETGRLVVGDEIEIVGAAAVGIVRYRISAIITDTATSATYQLNNTTLIVLASAVLSTNTFKIIRARNARRVGDFELIWRPPFSLFKQDKMLPAGEYRMILNSQTSSVFKLMAIETKASLTAVTGFDFIVTEVEFFYPRMKASRIKDLTYFIDLNEIRCQTTPLTGTSQQVDFNVEKSTYALTVAYQDNRVTSDALFSSSKFKMNSNTDRNITRLRVEYAGMTKPIPDADPNFSTTAPGTDFRTQRYYDSLFYGGAIDDAGGNESLDDMDVRGFYYHFDWVKDGSNTSTDVRINQDFSATPTNSNVLLFNHMRKVAKVVIKDHKVQSVTVEEM